MTKSLANCSRYVIKYAQRKEEERRGRYIMGLDTFQEHAPHPSSCSCLRMSP